MTSISRPAQDMAAIEPHNGSGDIEGQGLAYDLSKNLIVPIGIAEQQRRAVLGDVCKSRAPKEARAGTK